MGRPGVPGRAALAGRRDIAARTTESHGKTAPKRRRMIRRAGADDG